MELRPATLTILRQNGQVPGGSYVLLPLIIPIVDLNLLIIPIVDLNYSNTLPGV